jgi:hypothetical protein
LSSSAKGPSLGHYVRLAAWTLGVAIAIATLWFAYRAYVVATQGYAVATKSYEVARRSQEPVFHIRVGYSRSGRNMTDTVENYGAPAINVLVLQCTLLVVSVTGPDGSKKYSPYVLRLVGTYDAPPPFGAGRYSSKGDVYTLRSTLPGGNVAFVRATLRGLQSALKRRYGSCDLSMYEFVRVIYDTAQDDDRQSRAFLVVDQLAIAEVDDRLLLEASDLADKNGCSIVLGKDRPRDAVRMFELAKSTEGSGVDAVMNQLLSRPKW